jgi:hypothetical protein
MSSDNEQRQSIYARFNQLREEDEALDAKRDALLAELLAEEGNGIDTHADAKFEATKQVVEQAAPASESSVSSESPEASSPSVAESESPSVSESSSPEPESSENSSSEVSTPSEEGNPSLGESTEPEVVPQSSEVSEETGGLLAATDTAGGIKDTGSTPESSQPDAQPNVVGGGDASPADLAEGFQPVPNQPISAQLNPPTPEDSDFTPSPAEELKNEPLAGHRNVNLPGEDKESAKEIIANSPDITHQGQPGSGVAPGAALPGESVANRNARKVARINAAEYQRAIENGGFRFSGKLSVSDGGINIVSGQGTENEISLADLLGFKDGQMVTIEIVNI